MKYKINKEISLYQVSKRLLPQHVNSEKFPTGLTKLDKILGGGLPIGSLTVITQSQDCEPWLAMKICEKCDGQSYSHNSKCLNRITLRNCANGKFCTSYYLDNIIDEVVLCNLKKIAQLNKLAIIQLFRYHYDDMMIDNPIFDFIDYNEMVDVSIEVDDNSVFILKNNYGPRDVLVRA